MGSGGAGDKCGQFLRCLIVAANFIILVMSIGLIVVTGIIFSKMRPSAGMIPHEAVLPALGFTLVIPVLALLISFLGCCGAIRESKCMLITYCVVVSVLLVLVLAAIIVMFGVNSSSDEIKKELKDSLRDSDHREVWDRVQASLHCCGVDGPGDWAGQTPLSCSDKSTSTYYQTGCYDRLLGNMPTVIGVTAGLAIFLLISICAVGGLVRSVNKYSEMV